MIRPRALLLVTAPLLCAAVLSWLDRPVAPPEPATYSGKLSFLALGDSYTIGQGVELANRWPVQLAHSLRADGVDLSDPRIIARTGWTTADLLAAIDDAKPPTNFDLVTLLIGVNNQFQHRPQSEYRAEFRTLVNRSIALAGNQPTHVVVLSIPDWGAAPFGGLNDRARVAVEIDQFNAIAAEESQAAGVAFVDVTPSSRTIATQPAAFAQDGLHPSGQQYAKWVECALPAVRAALK